MVERGTTFLCLSESNYENKLAFAFLTNIRDIFFKNEEAFDDSILSSKMVPIFYFKFKGSLFKESKNFPNQKSS
jgi:hypothetical protein